MARHSKRQWQERMSKVSGIDVALTSLTNWADGEPHLSLFAVDNIVDLLKEYLMALPARSKYKHKQKDLVERIEDIKNTLDELKLWHKMPDIEPKLEVEEAEGIVEILEEYRIFLITGKAGY